MLPFFGEFGGGRLNFRAQYQPHPYTLMRGCGGVGLEAPGTPSSPKNRQLYTKVAHNISKVAHNYRPLAFQVVATRVSESWFVRSGH